MVNMKLILFSVITLFSAVLAQHGFGISYLKNSKMCHQWTCISNKLNLPDALPPREQLTHVLNNLLPPGSWQDVVPKSVDVCYGERPRIYTNTCPGQALLQCVVDQFIQNCPNENWRKKDACAPLTSLAGFKYMFSQSRYEDLENNLPKDRRPAWFLKNYFNSKCCDLPEMLNATVLSECGFTSLMFYHIHPLSTRYSVPGVVTQKSATMETSKSDVEKVQIVDFYNANTADQPLSTTEKEIVNSIINPLKCCDLSSYIDPAWGAECGFEMFWNGTERLAFNNVTMPVSATESPAMKQKVHDVKVLPVSCEQETCIFRAANIITGAGSVDLDGFSKLLDNLTNAHPTWVKAKGRVITKCLTNPLLMYEDQCDINKVLACTFDILSESCPHAKKGDPCKHSNVIRNDTVCQISSSKYRPKNRRQFCAIPNLVNHEILAQCNVNSISRLELVPESPATVRPTFGSWSRYSCKETTPATKCVLNKMDVLNKYGFMDYFKMKDRIRSATSDAAWSSLTEVYLSTFMGTPMYLQHCSSSRKLLNVLDAMVTTCPISKRKHTLECNRMFTDMINTAPVHTKSGINRQKLDQIVNRIRQVYLPLIPRFMHSRRNLANPNIQVKPAKVIKSPRYDFGILNSNNVPPVNIIDVKKTEEKKPLVLLPVYLRAQAGFKVSGHPNDGIFRSDDPYALHKQIAMAHVSSTTEGAETAKF